MKESLRLNDADAELKEISLSEPVRTAISEKIEDEIDLEVYERAHRSFTEDPVTYTLVEAEKELGL